MGRQHVDPFSADPLLERLDRTDAGPAALILGSAAVGPLVLILGAALDGNLWLSRALPDEWWRDIEHLFGLEDGNNSGTVPLLRDLWSFVTAAMVSSIIGILVVQWRAFRAFARTVTSHPGVELKTAGEPSAEERNDWARGFDSAFLRLRQRTTARALAAGLLTLTLQLGYQRTGVFRAIGFDPASTRQSLDLWWASSSHFFGFLSYFLVTSVFCYFLLLQNEANLSLLLWFRRVNHVADMSFDIDDARNFYGWSSVREFMGVGLIALVLDALALLISIGVVASPDSLVWFMPLSILYLLTIPTFLILPQRWFRAQMQAWKDRESEIQRSIARSEHESELRRMEARDLLDKIEDDVPDSIYNWKRYLLAVIAVLVGLVSFYGTIDGIVR